MKILTAITIISSIIAPMHAETLSPAIDLRSDGATDLLGGSAKPMLTWQIVSDERGVTASSWQVLVASSEALLAQEKGDLWDSGKVAFGRAPGSSYAGKELAVGARCHWKVRWWVGGDEPSPWSEPAVWEVAPAQPADWQGAVWIDDGKENPTEDADFYKPDPAPLMRREFEVTKPIIRARLHIAGLGLSMPSIDGQALADHVFDPPWTNFDKRILFRSHDVTDMLKEGKHCLGIQLGNGWFNPLPLRMWSHRNIRGSMPVGRPRAIALLVMDHPDGTSTTVTTDEAWKTTTGPTLRNSIYLGEERDARLEKDGWDKPEFDESDWKKVRITNAPLEPLQPLHMPPVRAKEILAAKSVNSPSKGVHIVDFGEIFTGLAEGKLNVPAGTRITFRYGELLHEDGSLNPMTR